MYLQGTFLSVISGIDPSFPKFIWDNLLAQTYLTLNLLRQATLNPCISAWGYLKGAFEYVPTPLGTTGCKIIIHTTSKNRKYWYQRGREGFSVGPALHHYRCIQAIDRKTKPMPIIYTEEYLYEYLTQPIVTAEEIITHAI